jgi:hypothetical protein
MDEGSGLYPMAGIGISGVKTFLGSTSNQSLE